MNNIKPVTLSEITSQPENWRLSLNRLHKSGRYPVDDFSNYKQLIFCGCGSTYYLSQWAASLTEFVKA